MNEKFVYKTIRWAISLVALIVLAFVVWGMKNVILALTGDALRVFVVVAAYLTSALLYVRYVVWGLERKDKNLLIASCAALLVAFGIGAGFVLADYSINMFHTFDGMDARVRAAVSVIIWIVCAVLLACNFALAIYTKHAMPRIKIPLNIIVIEFLASAFAIWGNAWGTSDAVYTLTSDTLSSIGMAITLDLVIFIMGCWYIIANDETTAQITLVSAAGGLLITSGMQVLDGALRGGGASVEHDYQAIAQFGFPAIAFISLALLAITLIADHYHGGLSFVREDGGSGSFGGKRNRDRERGGNWQVQRPREERREPSQDLQRPALPARASEESGQGKNRHGKSSFAAGGGAGLPEDLNKALKEMYYSNKARAKMSEAEARRIVDGNIPPRPDQLSGNAPNAKPNAPAPSKVGANGNGSQNGELPHPQ